LHEILVTGIGPVSAIGIGRMAWEQGVHAGVPGTSPLSLFPADHPTAEVRGFDLGAILPSIKTYLDRASEFALAAAQLALIDAGLATGDWKRWRAGVVVGSEYGCLPTMQTYTVALQQKGPRQANPLLFSHMYVNAPTSLIAIEFGLGGHHGTYAGHGAGPQALEGAIEALTLGRAELLVVAGVDVLSEPLYRALAAENTLGDLPLGEGACALILETAAHADARGATGVPLGGLAPEAAPVRALLGSTGAAEACFALAIELGRSVRSV
jgi:3-oxoacyl-[acyl-carrier-protein] synthase II